MQTNSNEFLEALAILLLAGVPEEQLHTLADLLDTDDEPGLRRLFTSIYGDYQEMLVRELS